MGRGTLGLEIRCSLDELVGGETVGRRINGSDRPQAVPEMKWLRGHHLMEMEGPGGFYVGVRVWLWFYERRAKVPLVGRADVPKSAVEKW